MSTLIVEIVEIKSVKKHPNADRLDVVTVKGWQCVTQKDLYKAGEKVIYCPIDGIIPFDLSEKMEITNLLSKGKVRTIKLRGLYSQGLLISLDHLPEDKRNLPLGTDVKDLLGITKYEAPVKVQMSGVMRKHHPDFLKYTDIENIKNFPDVLDEGEEVVITEKIHGSNFRIANIDGELYIGSHNVNLKPTPVSGFWSWFSWLLPEHKIKTLSKWREKNLYWKMASDRDWLNILKPGQQIFGEIYGAGVQNNFLYDSDRKQNVRFFDLMEDKEYVDYSDFKDFCINNNLPMVPFLYLGKWSNDLMKLADGKSTLGPNVKEGFVVKPTIERVFSNYASRVIFKHINEEFLTKNEDN